MKKIVCYLMVLLGWTWPAGTEEAPTGSPLAGIRPPVGVVSEKAATRESGYPAADFPQFRSGGHVLGFKPDRVYITGMGFALIEEFVGTKGCRPIVRTDGKQPSVGGGVHSGRPPCSTRGIPGVMEGNFGGL